MLQFPFSNCKKKDCCQALLSSSKQAIFEIFTLQIKLNELIYPKIWYFEWLLKFLFHPRKTVTVTNAIFKGKDIQYKWFINYLWCHGTFWKLLNIFGTDFICFFRKCILNFITKIKFIGIPLKITAKTTSWPNSTNARISGKAGLVKI